MTRDGTKFFNINLANHRPDEVLVTDYKTHERTSINNFKFKTSQVRLQLWKQAISEEFEGDWTEDPGSCMMLKTKSPDDRRRTLIYKLHFTGIITVMGSALDNWDKTHFGPLQSRVNQLDSTTGTDNFDDSLSKNFH